jgi:hypothetical protein
LGVKDTAAPQAHHLETLEETDRFGEKAAGEPYSHQDERMSRSQVGFAQ